MDVRERRVAGSRAAAAARARALGLVALVERGAWTRSRRRARSTSSTSPPRRRAPQRRSSRGPTTPASSASASSGTRSAERSRHALRRRATGSRSSSSSRRSGCRRAAAASATACRSRPRSGRVPGRSCARSPSTRRAGASRGCWRERSTRPAPTFARRRGRSGRRRCSSGAGATRSCRRLATAWREAVPHARLVMIAGAGHVPMVERPAEFASAVRGFLDEPRDNVGGAPVRDVRGAGDDGEPAAR